MDIIFDFIVCFLATFCFCFIMNVPKKALFTASFFAGLISRVLPSKLIYTTSPECASNSNSRS